jgi:hypothetical protein
MKIEVGQKFILKDKDDFYHNGIFLLVQGGFVRLTGKELQKFCDEHNKEYKKEIERGGATFYSKKNLAESWARLPYLQLIEISHGSYEFVNPPVRIRKFGNVTKKEWKLITRNRPDKFQPYNKKILV